MQTLPKNRFLGVLRGGGGGGGYSKIVSGPNDLAFCFKINKIVGLGSWAGP